MDKNHLNIKTLNSQQSIILLGDSSFTEEVAFGLRVKEHTHEIYIYIGERGKTELSKRQRPTRACHFPLVVKCTIDSCLTDSCRRVVSIHPGGLDIHLG